MLQQPGELGMAFGFDDQFVGIVEGHELAFGFRDISNQFVAKPKSRLQMQRP